VVSAPEGSWGRAVSESGRLRQGAGAYPPGQSPLERANVAYALTSQRLIETLDWIMQMNLCQN